MKKENLKASESTADGNAHALRGVWAEELKSIEEIRQAKGKIVDAETYKNLDNAIWNETTKLSDLLVTEQKAEELERSWVAPDEYMIEEVLKKLKPNSNIKTALEKAELRSDKKAVDAVKRYMELLKATPVQYFESKPQRAVDFSEFAGVIMPTSQEYDSIADAMAEYGLKVVRSDAKQAAVKEFEDVFFQGQIFKNIENIPSIEDFRNPNKDYELPRLNPSDLFKLGKEDKPVILKKNIIEKNKNNHPEVDISEYGKILTDTLVDTSEIIQAQPQKKPNYYTFINDNQNDVSVVELSENKDNYEVVNFFKVNKRRIDEYRKKAVKDGGDVIITERKPQGAARLSALLNNSNNSITPKEENVNSNYQNKPQPKGLYDANKGVIKIFESADFSTLPHELAHYWFDNMWSYVRSGNASEKYRQRWNVIANWLNVKQEQAFLTPGQWEKFARGYEQYLLNGNLPTPIIKGAFDDYDRWLKRVYGDMNRLNVRLSEDAVRFFQSMTTGVLPPQDTSDIIQQAADGLGQLPDVIVIADGGTLADRAFLIFFQKRNVHWRKQAVQIFPAGRRGGSVFGKTVAQLVKFDRKPVFVRKFANNVALTCRIEKAFERIGIALPICAADFKQICRPVARNRTAPLFDRGQMQHKFYLYAGFGGRIEN